MTYGSDVLGALFPDLAETVGKFAPGTIVWGSSSWTSTGWRTVRKTFRRTTRTAPRRSMVAALSRPNPRPRWPERTSRRSGSRSIFAPVRVFVVSVMVVVFVVSVVFMIRFCIGVFRFNVRVDAGGEALLRVTDEDDAVQVGGLLNRIGSSKGGGVGQAGKGEQNNRGEQDHSFHRESWEYCARDVIERRDGWRSSNCWETWIYIYTFVRRRCCAEQYQQGSTRLVRSAAAR